MAISGISPSPSYVSTFRSLEGKGRASGDAVASAEDPDVQRQIQKLKQTDAKVRAHEAAHQASGAGIAQGATYTYVRGPDGRQYAVAGEVSIDTSPASTPQQTIAKAQQIQRAALAPAEPSAQDLRVAASAVQMESRARAEMQQQREDGGQEPSGLGAWRSANAISAYNVTSDATRSGTSDRQEASLSLFA